MQSLVNPVKSRSIVDALNLRHLYPASRKAHGCWAYLEDGSLVFHTIQNPANESLETDLRALERFIRHPWDPTKLDKFAEKRRMLITTPHLPGETLLQSLDTKILVGIPGYGQENYWDISLHPFLIQRDDEKNFAGFKKHRRLSKFLAPNFFQRLILPTFPAFRGTLIDGHLQPNVRLANRVQFPESYKSASAIDSEDSILRARESNIAPNSPASGFATAFSAMDGNSLKKGSSLSDGLTRKASRRARNEMLMMAKAVGTAQIPRLPANSSDVEMQTQERLHWEAMMSNRERELSERESRVSWREIRVADGEEWVAEKEHQAAQREARIKLNEFKLSRRQMGLDVKAQRLDKVERYLKVKNAGRLIKAVDSERLHEPTYELEPELLEGQDRPVSVEHQHGSQTENTERSEARYDHSRPELPAKAKQQDHDWSQSDDFPELENPAAEESKSEAKDPEFEEPALLRMEPPPSLMGIRELMAMQARESEQKQAEKGGRKRGRRRSRIGV